jgi:hypothetical protein
MLPAVRRLLAILCLIAVLAVAGCGGGSSSSSSGSSSQSSASSGGTTASGSDQQLRAKFISAVKAKLGSGGLPADYVSCVIGKAEQIPTAQLKALGAAAAFSPNNKSAIALGAKLGKDCIAEGAGLSTFRKLMLSSLRKGLAAKGVSSAFQQCFSAKFDQQVSDKQLSAIILQYVQGGGNAAQSAGKQIGSQVVAECRAQGVSP